MKSIARLRKQQGLSQVALAKKARLTQQYISLIESGARVPTRRALRDIARALGVKLDELTGGAR